MPAARRPDSTWEIGGTGRAVVFLGSGNGITGPIILAADGTGATDFDATTIGLDGQGSFLEQALERRRDVILIGRTTAVPDLGAAAALVCETVLRTTAERLGEQPLVVAGVGRGALVARMALVRMEAERIDHQTATYVSYNGAAPTSDEQTVLAARGDWPQRPRLVGAVTSDFTGGPDDDHFDEILKGPEKQSSAVIDGALATTILELL